MPSFTPPAGYDRIMVVNSFDALVATPFGGGVNALCWPRTLPGDFGEVVAQLGASEGITTLGAARLRALSLGAAGRAAVDVLLEDQQRLRALGLAPELNCIADYPRDEENATVPIDVYSWHADSATVPTDTWLCSYSGPASEGLRHDEAKRCVDLPATRTKLLKICGGADDADFLEYLKENCYDLHYDSAPHARPFPFGTGNLWRIAVDYPGSPVPPCIHRAPATLPGSPPRLLLIS